MPLEPDISQQLMAARRELLDLEYFTLTRDYYWHAESHAWVLSGRITHDGPADHVPRGTQWCILIDPNYPIGSIDIYPAKIDSIIRTYQHQEPNVEGRYEWRTGKVCVADRDFSLGRNVYNPEPRNYKTRLKWHIQRLREWLTLAASGALIQDGDYFELPALLSLSDIRIVFAENPAGLGLWRECAPRYGFLTYSMHADSNIIIRSFESFKQNEIFKYNWGEAITEREIAENKGMWVTLPELPVIPEWQLPMNWGQLFTICKSQSVDLEKIIQDSVFKLGGHGPSCLLIGSPIPEKIGEEERRMHWFAIDLPPWSNPAINRDGFRPGARGAWSFDFSSKLKNECLLRWIKTENWDIDEISNRGRGTESLRAQRIVVIGVGALGTLVVENLARLGVTNLLLVDGDYLTIGNLARHTLTTNEVGKPKVVGVAERLNSMSPHMWADYISEQFPPRSLEAVENIKNVDVVIDCTASDDVCDAMAQFNWGNPKYFFSASVSATAEKLFLYREFGNRFSVDAFHEMIDGMMEEERKQNNQFDFPRDGVGCYHPVFPGRYDAFSVWAVAVVDYVMWVLESEVEQIRLPHLEMIQRLQDNYGMPSINRVVRDADSARSVVAS